MKKFKILIAIITNMAGSAAFAEPIQTYIHGGVGSQNISTMCQTVGNTEVCDTQRQPNNSSWLVPFSLERHRSKKMGQLVAANDCEGARRYALHHGDFKQIHNAVALCVQQNAAKVAAIEAAVQPRPDLTPYQQGKLLGEAQAGADK